MTADLPLHISSFISDEEDEKNFQNAGVYFSRSYPDEYGVGDKYDLLFGTASDTIARISYQDDGFWKINIDKRFPDIGYNGIRTRNSIYAQKCVHEWWSTVFQIVIWKFDIANYLDEIDLNECIECFSLKVLADAELEARIRSEERMKKAGESIQSAINRDQDN